MEECWKWTKTMTSKIRYLSKKKFKVKISIYECRQIKLSFELFTVRFHLGYLNFNVRISVICFGALLGNICSLTCNTISPNMNNLFTIKICSSTDSNLFMYLPINIIFSLWFTIKEISLFFSLSLSHFQ